MKISHNEFHISKKIRDLCNFDGGLFASSGNVVFANMKNVRAFQLLINNVFESRGEENKKLSAGQLNAMGLIDEILHYVCMLYRRDKVLTFMDDLLATLDKEFGRDEVDGLLLDFIREFPPVAVYKEKIRPEEYLAATELDAGTGVERTNRAQTLEELILLHLANENKAFQPFMIMFSDKELAKNKLYAKSWKIIQKYAAGQPFFGPFNHDLITLLREPQVFAPDSLRGQLEYLQKYWADFLGEWLKRILAGMDTISEEEKAAWHGFGGGDLPDMQPYSFENLMNEYERFSADSEWMPKVILIAKTVLVWLDQLTKQYGYPITRLDQIPDAELDKLRDEGFTGLWLIGLWERSKASRRIKQICGNPEAAASAYSLFDYNIASNIGGWDALANLRQRCWQRGIRLASDMVPNHTGMDGDWVINHPDYFIQRRDNPFPQYTYNGENLSQDGRVSLFLEDHYYSKNDCSVVFKRVDNQTGDTRYIYHGNDGTGLPWNDTAQIDFLNPTAREAVMQEILHVAQNFPIIRFDAAMVLAKKSGDIATRSETGLSTQQFNDAIPNEFWREVVDRVAAECPDTLLLAEAFWMMEGYFVRTLGMHRVYNSAFMNMLKKEENQKYRETVKNTITFDPQVLKRYVNFMNNPDEETAIAQFGDGDKYFGVCTLMITMPGLPMFGHGQIEGFTEKYGMEYTKAYKDEKPSQYLVDRHWHDIFPLMKKRYLFSGVDNFLFYDLWEDGHVNENVFAYSNGADDERAVVFYNNKYDRAAGWIKQSDPYAVKTGNGDEVVMKSRSISEGLNLTAEDDKYCIFQEHRSRLWFIRKSSEVCEKGLFVMLNGFEYQVYLNVHQVSDEADGRYRILCDFLAGRGCEDIETAWQELIYKDLYADLHAYAGKVIAPLFEAFGYEKIKDKSEAESAETANAAKKSSKSKTAAKKPAALTAKKVTDIMTSSNKELTAFVKTASKFSDKNVKLDAAKEAAEITARLKKLVAIHNLKKTKAPADLQKALLKAADASAFAGLMEVCDAGLEKQLLCWALCGTLAEKGSALEFAFGRKFNEYLREEKLSDKDERWNLTKLFVLAAATSPAAIKKDSKLSAFEVTKLMMQGRWCGLLSGTNNFDNIRWFNKELSDDSLNKTILLLALAGKTADFANIQKFNKLLSAAKTKAAYKCENMLKEFEPKVLAKKTTKKAPVAKKPAATKKPTAAKKQAAKAKPAAKSSATKKPETQKAPAKKTQKK